MEKSDIIQKKAMELPIYEESETIGLYADFNNEVSTSLIFNDALERGKTVLLPCIRREKKELLFSRVHGREELEPGPYGVLAPPYEEGKKDRLGDAELLFIPGVGYDLKGGRIGYGGGYYDRSLQRLVRPPFIVALAYEFQIVDEIPVFPHDIRVDAIVTEERVIRCKGRT